MMSPRLFLCLLLHEYPATVKWTPRVSVGRLLETHESLIGRHSAVPLRRPARPHPDPPAGRCAGLLPGRSARPFAQRGVPPRPQPPVKRTRNPLRLSEFRVSQLAECRLVAVSRAVCRYGGVGSRDALSVLTAGRGSCSGKHLLLAALLRCVCATKEMACSRWIRQG